MKINKEYYLVLATHLENFIKKLKLIYKNKDTLIEGITNLINSSSDSDPRPYATKVFMRPVVHTYCVLVNTNGIVIVGDYTERELSCLDFEYDGPSSPTYIGGLLIISKTSEDFSITKKATTTFGTDTSGEISTSGEDINGIWYNGLIVVDGETINIVNGRTDHKIKFWGSDDNRPPK